MTKLWVRNICRVIIVAAICGGFSSSILSSATMVEIGNHIALGQMENSDFNALVLSLYNQVRHTILAVDAAAIGLAIIAGIRDTYQFYFPKENTDEEA